MPDRAPTASRRRSARTCTTSSGTTRSGGGTLRSSENWVIDRGRLVIGSLLRGGSVRCCVIAGRVPQIRENCRQCAKGRDGGLWWPQHRHIKTVRRVAHPGRQFPRSSGALLKPDDRMATAYCPVYHPEGLPVQRVPRILNPRRLETVC